MGLWLHPLQIELDTNLLYLNNFEVYEILHMTQAKDLHIRKAIENSRTPYKQRCMLLSL